MRAPTRCPASSRWPASTATPWWCGGSTTTGRPPTWWRSTGYIPTPMGCSPPERICGRGVPTPRRGPVRVPDMAANRTRRATGSPNPADDRGLRRALQRHVQHLAATITYTDPQADRPRGHAEQEYRERIAAAWVYLSCVAVWAEDHRLVVPLLRQNPRG